MGQNPTSDKLKIVDLPLPESRRILMWNKGYFSLTASIEFSAGKDLSFRIEKRLLFWLLLVKMFLYLFYFTLYSLLSFSFSFLVLHFRISGHLKFQLCLVSSIFQKHRSFFRLEE